MNNQVPQYPFGPTCFVTIALADPDSHLLLNEFDRLRAAVRLTWREQPFFAHAWVVLPGRMHCVWSLPPGDVALAPRWGDIKQRFQRSTGTAPDLWQPGWTARRLDGMADFAECVRYCWFAPVHMGKASNPEDWAYSSLYDAEKPVRQVA